MFELGKRKIGDGFPPLVIAEIGINHNGCIKTAKAMVDSAKRAGVEVVKIQSHVISDEMSSEAKKVIPGNADKSIYDIMKDMEKFPWVKTFSKTMEAYNSLLLCIISTHGLKATEIR